MLDGGEWGVTGRGGDLLFVAEFAGQDDFFLAWGVVELWTFSIDWAYRMLSRFTSKELLSR